MRIAINGFGRIGRIFLRTILAKPGIDVVAINDQADTATLAHLFKYDSVHRGFKGTVTNDEGNMYINGNQIKVCNKPIRRYCPGRNWILTWW
jgi:glyceraldehyde 3-phosphate dehydrogenase